MVSNRFFTPGQDYRDKGAPNDPDDQFMRWINRPGSGMANAPGIRPLRYVAKRPFTDLPAFLVLVTKKASQGGGYNPWDDVVDLQHGTVSYWGDAKLHPEKLLTDFSGNKVLQKVWEAVREGRREELPPILHFVKNKSGWVTFTGLCEMTTLRPDSFEEKGQLVENLRCQLRILGPTQVPLSWLHTRREAETPQEALHGAPESWASWVRGDRLAASPSLNAEALALLEVADEDSASGQGFSSDPRIRKAVEDHAMKRARAYFHQAGITSIEDVSRRRSFDLYGHDGRREVCIEVKGTETAGAHVWLTPREVEFARLNKHRMALYVLHSVRIRDMGGEVIVEGGEERVYWPWDVDSGLLAPIKYAYFLP